jgi:hypothetical protein
VEIHDVGRYAFKGVSHDFSIKSINVRALSQRNEDYKGDLKASKASKTAPGTGFERVWLPFTFLSDPVGMHT